MIKVIGVRFKRPGKVYYFDPAKIEALKEGAPVIVETARGMEYGTVAMEPTEVKKEDLVLPLKPVVRKANEKDIKKNESNISSRERVLRICKESVATHKLDMKIIDVGFTFDNNKIIFYFTADGRIDFRDLVKDLASELHARIELRQVGTRDEAKLIGGIGACGRTLCCASWITEFKPVSIKMAKTQNLSLNPSKISGTCGRLMCCLNYENEAYKELKKGMPNIGEDVYTKDGKAKVIGMNLFEGSISVRLYTDEEDEDGNIKLDVDVKEYSKEDLKQKNTEKTKRRKSFNKDKDSVKSSNKEIDK